MRLCRHFGTCGGCAFQDVPEGDYLAGKRRLVEDALARAGVAAAVEAAMSVPPFTRRRAGLKIAKNGNAVEIGFHARASHDIADMRECLVLAPSLTALVQTLRGFFASLLRTGEGFDLDVTDTGNGIDLSLGWKRAPAHVAQLAELPVARITLGGAMLVEHDQPAVSFSGVAVKLPPDAFLQPTEAGEAALQARVTALLGRARYVADLFAGCGTFTFGAARHAKVHAVEKDAAMLAALETGARKASGLKPVTVEKRDLFKRPLGPKELAVFDAVLLDPPRAGAAAQVAALAASGVGRIVYVSCDAASFARDARVLIGAGFRLGPVAPIDQFLWSGHIELVAGFER